MKCNRQCWTRSSTLLLCFLTKPRPVHMTDILTHLLDEGLPPDLELLVDHHLELVNVPQGKSLMASWNLWDDCTLQLSPVFGTFQTELGEARLCFPLCKFKGASFDSLIGQLTQFLANLIKSVCFRPTPESLTHTQHNLRVPQNQGYIFIIETANPILAFIRTCH